jgi:glycosyltransferase involved in cell wall biosynthesis
MSRPSMLSVVIPTYQRPEWIRRAVRSLAVQSRPPDEVIAVARDTDIPTHESIATLQAEGLPFKLRRELVSEPGFIPPVRAGLPAATGDIVAVMDDDAEAAEGWGARLMAH